MALAGDAKGRSFGNGDGDGDHDRWRWLCENEMAEVREMLDEF